MTWVSPTAPVTERYLYNQTAEVIAVVTDCGGHCSNGWFSIGVSGEIKHGVNSYGGKWQKSWWHHGLDGYTCWHCEYFARPGDRKQQTPNAIISLSTTAGSTPGLSSPSLVVQPNITKSLTDRYPLIQKELIKICIYLYGPAGSCHLSHNTLGCWQRRFLWIRTHWHSFDLTAEIRLVEVMQRINKLGQHKCLKVQWIMLKPKHICSKQLRQRSTNRFVSTKKDIFGCKTPSTIVNHSTGRRTGNVRSTQLSDN